MHKIHLVKLLIVSVLASILMSCDPQEEKEVTPAITDPIVALPFSALNPPINVPGPLNASNNSKAKEIVDILRSVNAITSYGNDLIVPADADVSTTPVSGSAFHNSNTAVYSWVFNNGSQFVTSAYQISEVEGTYRFELFHDYGDGLNKFLEGKESKNDLRNGSLLYYGIMGSNQAQLDYKWTESTSQGFQIILINAARRIEVTIASDNSGKADVFTNNVPSESYTWNGAGTSGNYTYYNSSGTVEQSGGWAG